MKHTLENKSEIVKSLNSLLANYEMYYQNLRALHWNVKGKLFFMLHAKYEELYNEAAHIIDEVAERILMLEETPLHTYADFIKNSEISAVENISDAEKSMEIVLDNHSQLLEFAYKVNQIASNSGDEGTVALISEIISVLEKNIWMLSSSLK